jgi:GNAT superfamily N-acetyltransferase
MAETARQTDGTGSAALRFREATGDDLEAIAALLDDDAIARGRAGHVGSVTQRVRDAFAEIARSPDNELWVAELGGEVVGTLQLTYIPGLSRNGMRRALLEAVRVDAALRGRGVGAAFMRHAVERARARGWGRVQHTPPARRVAAHRFYERLGFVASHKGMKLAL